MIETDKNPHVTVTPEGLTAGVIGKNLNPIDYTLPQYEIRNREKGLISSLSGAEQGSIAFMNQVHGTTVIDVSLPLPENSITVGDCDGTVTADPGVCLVIRTADCVPVFMYDPAARVLGAAHSGWRGTRSGIVSVLAEKMVKDYGAGIKSMSAFILPSIGPKSYEVKNDVARFFPDDIHETGGRTFLDLWNNIERTLKNEGIPGDHIFNARTCTLKENDRFFSYRAGDGGRNLNFAMMT